MFFSRVIVGPRPMDMYMKAVPFRLIMSLIFAGIVWWTNQIPTSSNGEFPIYYYVIIITAFLLHQVF